jgi:motility quorum-sensing regulator/GCU-specific mRNA interferase toxin
MSVKRKPHHNLAAIKAKFATVETLEITGKAQSDAQDLGYTLEDIVDVVQALEPGDFIKSETAHSPPNSKVWHDTYNIPYDDFDLYLKFAGETLIDVTLTSFKEV